MTGIGEYILLMFLVAVAAGLVGSMVGVGGGILVVPALTIGFGVPIEYAIGASIISTIATSSASASAYVRDRITNLRLGMFLEIGSVLGSVVGVVATLYFVRSGLSWVIFVIFGLVLFFSAYSVVQNARIERAGESRVNTKPNRMAERLQLQGEYEDRSLRSTIRYVATEVPAGLGIMFFAGLLSGLLGVGGGTLKVLGMDTIMKIPFKVSTTTSNFMIGVTAAASEQPALRSGRRTALSGQRIAAVSAMKCTPQKTMTSALVFAAICESFRESATASATSCTSGRW